jgi:hypothetical protein
MIGSWSCALYIFISPIFYIEQVLPFADDSYHVQLGKNKVELIEKVETSLRRLMKWIMDPGLKINEEKTDLGLF